MHPLLPCAVQCSTFPPASAYQSECTPRLAKRARYLIDALSFLTITKPCITKVAKGNRVTQTNKFDLMNAFDAESFWVTCTNITPISNQETRESMATMVHLGPMEMLVVQD